MRVLPLIAFHPLLICAIAPRAGCPYLAGALHDTAYYSCRSAATTAAHELSPVCAVVGGLLAQDILKALAAREPPIANFFTFDGTLGGGTVVRMGMP